MMKLKSAENELRTSKGTVRFYGTGKCIAKLNGKRKVLRSP